MPPKKGKGKKASPKGKKASPKGKKGKSTASVDPELVRALPALDAGLAIELCGDAAPDDVAMEVVASCLEKAVGVVEEERAVQRVSRLAAARGLMDADRILMFVPPRMRFDKG
eukprot:CAMPEP_0118863320 /NCGR_PEP_ID=MMETSP1163-20130328/8224_1 /TAXON_ID=124430 /ORGANISM="Phaeomonas parva, Strain CCMP2877" /LENGTH=112 /DNA_ID=CAMNT_0006797315 /DNA_START=355 /DNA_END=689 /DNA_ORIENTATION=+